MESRWIRWVGPGAVALLAVGSLVTATQGAGSRSWTPPPCSSSASPGAVASAPAPVALSELGAEAWFRMDPQLDKDGALQGQRVSLGLDGSRSVQTVLLPSEAFAAGPFGGIVLLGSDDGATSTLEAIDVATGCAWTLATEAAVIRRATIDPRGSTIYDFRVDRATRADLGVWARPLTGSGARQVLEPIGPDERFGPTFTTELSWDASGELLAAQSCGYDACRTRFINRAGGPVRAISESDLGTLIGVDGDRLISYLACSGMPCSIVSIDLNSHARQTLADLAGVAVLTATPDGPRLVHEVFTESGLSLRSIASDGSNATDLGPIDEGLRLHSSPASSSVSPSSSRRFMKPQSKTSNSILTWRAGNIAGGRPSFLS